MPQARAHQWGGPVNRVSRAERAVGISREIKNIQRASYLDLSFPALPPSPPSRADDRCDR